MRHPSLLDRDSAAVLLIDLQDSYRAILAGWDSVERACELVVRGARLLEIPILATEQYPRGLGRTSAVVADCLGPDTPVIEKLTMSCCGAAGFLPSLRSLERRQIVVIGIETHACVNQTVHDLLNEGFEVHLAHDATSSRLARMVGPAVQRMTQAGALATTAEQALLELVRTAEAPEFRALQQLMKAVTA
jgi:nicotinamidase-related amidase